MDGIENSEECNFAWEAVMKDVLCGCWVIYKINKERISPVLNRKVASKGYTSLQELLHCFAYVAQPRQPTSTSNNLTSLYS